MEKYGIPFLIDIHTHFFPEYVMKQIWKWFDGVHWARNRDQTLRNLK
ncbi:hypothetical protein LEP1GSC019_2651 [Leptospira interrogans serovar Pyrogenes str. 2006006960]|nr:hypothetical protein LEP1GSC019_2651 [Leptospira interrogans serovar Pyrogenes str. 2006006960]